MTELDERELTKRIASGDRKAFTVFYTYHLNDLYRYIYLFTKSRHASEEILQNVFVKVWERREVLVNLTSLKAYLYRVTKNLILDEIRRSKIELKVFNMVGRSTETSGETTDSRLIYNQYYSIAQEAINLLPEKRKQIVELKTKDDLTLDEISIKLRISKSVVKKQLYCGMNFIRNYVREHAELTINLILFISLF